MKGTVPIVTCDHEDGCDEWMLDHYEMCVDNWKDFLDGWAYDPYRYRDDAFCPEHARADKAARGEG